MIHSDSSTMIKSEQTKPAEVTITPLPPPKRLPTLILRTQEKVVDYGSFDWKSKAGKFGWECIGRHYIPYIFRGREKYCSITIANRKLMDVFSHALGKEVFSCINIKSEKMTDAEAILFNSINNYHCDGFIGRYEFKSNELMWTLKDLIELIAYLEMCYSILVEGCRTCSMKNRTGFLEIGGSLVPFILMEGDHYVPIFYFEGNNEILKYNSKQTKGWDLTYLKLCFKIHGIRNDLFEDGEFEVVKLKDIEQFFLPNTELKFGWPTFNPSKFLKFYGVNHKYSTNIKQVKPPNNSPSENNNGNLAQFVGNKMLEIYPLLNGTEVETKKDDVDEISLFKRMPLPFLGKEVTCINMRPGVYTNLAISLLELYNCFFFKSTPTQFLFAIKTHQIHIYKPNRAQMTVLYGKAKPHVEMFFNLVLIKDVSDNIDTLRRMLM